MDGVSPISQHVGDGSPSAKDTPLNSDWRAAWDATLLEAPSREMPATPASASIDHPGPKAFSPLGASVSTEAASSAPAEERRHFASEAQRIDAVAAHTKSWQCSAAALARTARVDPADLSKWKKGLLPVESDKKARIEKALRNNEEPTPPAKRPRNS